MAGYITKEQVKGVIMSIEKPCDDTQDFYIPSTQELEIGVDELPTVPAIPLDRIKKLRETMAEGKMKNQSCEWFRWWNNGVESCLDDLDEIIEEYEI